MSERLYDPFAIYKGAPGFPLHQPTRPESKPGSSGFAGRSATTPAGTSPTPG